MTRWCMVPLVGPISILVRTPETPDCARGRSHLPDPAPSPPTLRVRARRPLHRIGTPLPELPPRTAESPGPAGGHRPLEGAVRRAAVGARPDARVPVAPVRPSRDAPSPRAPSCARFAIRTVSGSVVPRRNEPRRLRLVSRANGTRTSRIPSGANRKRIGTAKLGNRDERDPLPAIGPELAVSGSDSAVPPSQDPAKTREFLGYSRGAAAKSPKPQTRWRWGQTRTNPSLPPESLIYRESAGKSAGPGGLRRLRSRGNYPILWSYLISVDGNDGAAGCDASVERFDPDRPARPPPRAPRRCAAPHRFHPTPHGLAGGFPDLQGKPPGPGARQRRDEVSWRSIPGRRR
jgi:hypothetical protein